MSESMQEKTEQATPKRKEDAKKEGRVPLSRELTTAVLYLMGGLAVTTVGVHTATGMRDIFATMLVSTGLIGRDTGAAAHLLHASIGQVLLTIAPFIMLMTAAALMIAGVQGRGVVSLKAITPQWKRVNPVTNAKRFIGVQPWVELLKSLFKVLIIGLAVYFSLATAWSEMMALPQQEADAVIHVVRRYGLLLLGTAGAAYLVFAVGDYVYQVWHFEKNLRMTSEEVKREFKDSDGDPLLKARRRSIQREMARRQMFMDVATADVVVTNPTHIAVALRYDPDTHPAPIVLAMGQRKVAQRIKELAKEAKVPCVENKPIARALFRSATVGSMIPPELYLAVAEVLAFVMRQRAPAAGGRR